MFKMSRKDNVFYAKRNLVDTIWKNANVEGIAVTFPETKAIVEGGIINNISSLDVEKIINMKRGWEFIFNTLDIPISLNYIQQAHKLVAAEVGLQMAGKLRNVPVSIGGTEWKPPFPIESQIKEGIDNCLSIEDPTTRALTTMYYLMRQQMFIDGNKRMSMLIGNKLLIESGSGIFAVPTSKGKEWAMMLIKYYESNDLNELLEYSMNYCMDGFDSKNELININDLCPLLKNAFSILKNSEQDSIQFKSTFLEKVTDDSENSFSFYALVDLINQCKELELPVEDLEKYYRIELRKENLSKIDFTNNQSLLIANKLSSLTRDLLLKLSKYKENTMIIDNKDFDSDEYLRFFSGNISVLTDFNDECEQLGVKIKWNQDYTNATYYFNKKLLGLFELNTLNHELNQETELEHNSISNDKGISM